ncbi:MAG: hypothetical protein AAGF53_14155 [Pseudomonadota bacterium]
MPFDPKISDEKQPRIKRPVVSDADGTREGGLMFTISLILCLVGASFVHPLALTSFFVWFALLMLSASIAVGTQKLVARLNGFKEDEEDGAEAT